MDRAGEHLALVTAPYAFHDQLQGSVGILGPMRMQYERVMCVVLNTSRALSRKAERGS